MKHRAFRAAVTTALMLLFILVIWNPESLMWGVRVGVPVLVAAGIYETIQAARDKRLRQRRLATHCCPRCGYDLRGTPGGDCPECGAKRFG